MLLPDSLSPFTGKVVVITGSLEMLTRDKAKELVEATKAPAQFLKRQIWSLPVPVLVQNWPMREKLGVRTINESEF